MKFNKLLLLIIVAFISCNSSTDNKSKNETQDSTGKKHKKHKAHLNRFIEEEWEMPGNLKEISGMAFLSKTQLACIQDERGIVFIYDLETSEVVDQIAFAGKGDFEGIAIVNNSAFILRSDGVITEIKDIRKGDNISIVIHPTGLKTSQNTEGLCYDKKNNRLLISCKGFDPDYGNKKTVFAFDLKTNELIPDPVLLIDQDNPIFIREGKKNEEFQPSEISKNPLTNEYYFTDSPANKLFIITEDGKIREKKLDKSVLPQPEGIAISDNGELYLSSEGVDGPGIIVKINPDFLIN